MAFGLTLPLAGAAVAWATRQHRRELLPRDGFLLVNLVWLVLPAFSALPLLYTVPDMSWTTPISRP
jgi:trk system potassium uptake protein TrkH